MEVRSCTALPHRLPDRLPVSVDDRQPCTLSSTLFSPVKEISREQIKFFMQTTFYNTTKLPYSSEITKIQANKASPR